MKTPEIIKLCSLILKPQYGFKTNWVFNLGLKTSISVGVLGAVGITLFIQGRRYLTFSSSEHDVVYPRYWVVPGLQNLGNNCFLNVVLQALASCPIFQKYIWEMVEEYGPLSVEDEDESIPLVNTLALLVEELSTLRHKRTTLSPQYLMVMMEHYIPNFNLTAQQDAEEAFSHLLSSLREELSQHLVSNKSCLPNLSTLQNGAIINTISCKEESEWQRWSKCFLKPFDGIICSILVCQSCSFQISLDFQLFHSLHLSPLISSGATIIAGCTLEDCLERYFAAECVENYCCSNCWHAAAIEYSSVFAKCKTDIEKLQYCNKNDSCKCKNISSLEAFPWSNRLSRTFKQLSISRSPKILCIHLQRASYNMFGQSVKLQGHIAFPLILDMSPFMSTVAGIKDILDSRFGPSDRSNMDTRTFPFPKYPNMLIDPRKLNDKETKVAVGQESDKIEVENNGLCSKASESSLLDSERRVNANRGVILPSSHCRHQMYRLVSVVVHYGISGGGHYTVYRKVAAKLGNEDTVALLKSAIEQWFCVSDSEVHSVSEKDVLDANASMLFYEKIDSS